MSFTICNKFLLSSLTLLLVYLPEMFIRLPQVSPVFLQPSLSGSLTETGLLLHPIIWIFWKHYFWFQHRQLIIHIYDLQSPRRLQDVPSERVHGRGGKMPAQTWGFPAPNFSNEPQLLALNNSSTSPLPRTRCPETRCICPLWPWVPWSETAMSPVTSMLTGYIFFRLISSS